MGLEIAPKVRFTKKGQSQEQPTDSDRKLSAEENEKPENGVEENNNNSNATGFANDNDDEDDDENWFTVKSISKGFDEENINLPERSTKENKLTKAKLAKKLRKKNLLINKRVEYDEDGNVSSQIIISILFSMIIRLVQTLRYYSILSH